MPGSSESSESTDINPEINIDFQENSPSQEGVISETYQRPDKSFFEAPQELKGLVSTGNLVQKFYQDRYYQSDIKNDTKEDIQKYTQTC